MSDGTPRMIRITDDVWERIGVIAGIMASDPRMAALGSTGRVSSAAVTRVALVEGLELLESKYLPAAPAKRKTRKR